MSMPTIENLVLQLPIVLLHFLWQGAIIGVIAILANYLIGERWVRLGYAWNLLLLVCLLMCIPVTFAVLTRNSSIEVNPAVMAHRADNTVAVPPIDEGSTESIRTAEVEALAPKVAAVAMTSGITGETMMRICITIAYCLGVLAMLSRTALAAWKIHRLRGVGTSDSPEWLLTTIRSKAKQMGMAVAPALRVCNEVSVPVVVGLMRPLILVPTSILTNLNHHEIETILVHELAHIRRYDLWMNLFQRVVEAILFFHPAVWYVSKLASRYREMCCDEWVIRQGHDKLQYASALINMAKLSFNTGHRGIDDQLALAAGKVTSTDFNRRVRRLLGVQTVQHSGMREWLGFSTTAVAIIVLCCVIATSNSAAAQELTEYKTAEEKLDLLKKISAARRESFDKIHTWKATYKSESRSLRPDPQGAEQLLLQSSGELQFAVDLDKKLLRSYILPIGDTKVEAIAGQNVDKSKAPRSPWPSIESRVIVTPQEVFKYRQQGRTNIKGQIGWISGVDQSGAGGEVSIYKNIADNEMVYAPVYDPLKLLTFDGGGTKEKTYTAFEYIIMRIGTASTEERREWQEWLELMNVSRDKDTWVISTGKPESGVHTAIYDSSFQNCLERSFAINNEPFNKYQVQYTTSNGISIPSGYTEIRYDKGQEISRSVFKLVSSEMNPTLADKEFTVEAFDLQNGTRKVDYGDKSLKDFWERSPKNFGRRTSQEDRQNEQAKMTTVYLDGKWLSIEDYNKTVEK